MKIKIERCFNCNHHVITLVTKRWEEYECWKCGCGCMTIHRNVRDYPKENQLTKGEINMKVYKKDEVDNTFSNWQSDLGQLDVIEVYTKSDIVAMLTEIQLEIEEIKPLEPTDDEDWQYGCFHGLELMQDKCLRLIQQKINSLKREE